MNKIRVFITGATGGVEKSSAIRLAKEQYHVILPGQLKTSNDKIYVD